MRRTGLTPHPGSGFRPGRRGWRIRWRRVVGLLLGMILTGGVAGLVATTSQAAGPPAAPEVVVIQPGDTLWSVAARHLPSRDPYGMIEEIRRLNGLPDNTVYPGQELILP
jgi:hypothetical protein